MSEEVQDDKIVLTRKQVEFITGFIFGYFMTEHGIEFGPDDLEHVERMTAQALGVIFPLREGDIEDEIDRFLSSL